MTSGDTHQQTAPLLLPTAATGEKNKFLQSVPVVVLKRTVDIGTNVASANEPHYTCHFLAVHFTNRIIRQMSDVG